MGTVASQPTAFATGGRSRIPIITNPHNILSHFFFFFVFGCWFSGNFLLLIYCYAPREREREREAAI